MINRDEDALICDFAETYHILDYKQLPPTLAAVLASGLRDTSRIKLRLSGMRVGIDRILSAVIADRLSFIAWSKTKDAQHGRNKPKSIADMMLSGGGGENVQAYNTSDDFEKARQRILKGK